MWFGVSVSTAIRWAQRRRAEGHAASRTMGGDHSSRLKDHRAAVLDLVGREPDLSLAEIRDRLRGSESHEYELYLRDCQEFRCAGKTGRE
jgi:transposase